MLLGIGMLAISPTDSHLMDAKHIASYRITRCKLGLARAATCSRARGGSREPFEVVDEADEHVAFLLIDPADARIVVCNLRLT